MSEESIRQLVEELSGAALRDLLRNVRHHTELRRRIAAGEVDERAVNAAYREYARREGPAYRQQAADLTLQYYGDLTDLGTEYSERFYSEIMADGLVDFETSTDGARHESGNGDAPEPEPVHEVPVELHGPSGREVVAKFGLENTEDHPVRVTLEVGPCRGPDDVTFIAPLTVQPAEAELSPGETRQISLRLMLQPSVFVPGYLYRLPVLVHGPEEMRLLVNAWAEEPDVGLRPDPAPTSADDAPPAEQPTAAKQPPSAEQRPPAEPDGYLVRCPGCGRDFERAERTTRLYPHKTPDGTACPERKGRVRVDRRSR